MSSRKLVRATIRDAITIFFIVLTSPLWITVRLIGRRGREVEWFSTLGQALSLIPGRLGTCSRRAFYVMTLDACAWDVGVGFGSWFSKRRVQIGMRVSFGAHCLIGSCSIGEGTLFGSNIDVLSGRYQHSPDGSHTSRAEQVGSYSQLMIGRNVWIGSRTVVMADVGDNSVVGAGSVVVQSLPDNVVAVGNPARLVRSLSDSRSPEFRAPIEVE